MKAEKYYSVYAKNGFLCTNKWDKVLKMRQYFRGDQCKSYEKKEDAINATRNGYNEIHDTHYYIGEIELNKPRFRKDFKDDEVL